jgi:hypothetical protein
MKRSVESGRIEISDERNLPQGSEPQFPYRSAIDDKKRLNKWRVKGASRRHPQEHNIVKKGTVRHGCWLERSHQCAAETPLGSAVAARQNVIASARLKYRKMVRYAPIAHKDAGEAPS